MRWTNQSVCGGVAPPASKAFPPVTFDRHHHHLLHVNDGDGDEDDDDSDDNDDDDDGGGGDHPEGGDHDNDDDDDKMRTTTMVMMMMIQSYLMRLAGVLVASLPPFPQIWTDGQFTIHRKAIKIKQDFSISLQYGMARADIHLARLRPSPRYHLHDSLYLNCISQLVFQLYFSRVFLNCISQTPIPSS